MSFIRAASVFPVSDVEVASAHYRLLGFEVEAYTGDAAYAFCRRDGVEIHLGQVSGVDPKENLSALYLYVSDADALHAKWQSANLKGRLVSPTDTEYGLREGAHIDPDGNLIRFGSEI